jgi:hypothetical protein
MKKNILYLIIISSILMLVGWTTIGSELKTQELNVVVSESNPRVEVPDYPLDGKFFTDTYRKNVPSSTSLDAPDYRLDAEFFNDWYQDVSKWLPNKKIPDYPLDGKLFLDQYIDLP